MVANIYHFVFQIFGGVHEGKAARPRALDFNVGEKKLGGVMFQVAKSLACRRTRRLYFPTYIEIGGGSPVQFQHTQVLLSAVLQRVRAKYWPPTVCRMKRMCSDVSSKKQSYARILNEGLWWCL